MVAFPIGLLIAALLAAPGNQASFPCAMHKDVKGPCVTRRGRLYVMNGIPVRIWMIGTRRHLAVAEDSKSFLIPEALLNLVDFDTNLYGDFTVCPLEPEQPGPEPIRWQEPGRVPFVCVASGTRLVLEHIGDSETTSWPLSNDQN